MTLIAFDPATGNACRWIEDRPDGHSLYEDTQTGDRIICQREAMSLFPLARDRSQAFPIVFVA